MKRSTTLLILLVIIIASIAGWFVYNRPPAEPEISKQDCKTQKGEITTSNPLGELDRDTYTICLLPDGSAVKLAEQ